MLVARELGVTLAQVLRVKSGDGSGLPGRPSAQKVNQVPMNAMRTADSRPVHGQVTSEQIKPREIVDRLIKDLDECVVLALAEYRADPSSETGYNAVSSITSTLNALIKAHDNLNDPQETAESIVTSIMRPLVKSVLSTLIKNFDTLNKELSLTFTSENQRMRFKDSLSDVLRAVSDQVRGDYNRGVRTLEGVYNVPLDKMYLKKTTTHDAPSVD